jgi:peptidoglycan/LPS O-acetylase OafA/YrhL
MHPDLRSAGHAPHFQYCAAVDGLRGIAVLAVLGFHAFPETVSGGYIGVDVFFVISGFLITSIIARQLRHGAFSFADFYWRRVRRLFPALVIVLAATLALGWLVMLPDEFKQLGKLVGSSSVFAANLALWRESGYFDRAAELKPLLHLWSLGIEEQFYLVWPAILVGLWRRRILLLVVIALVAS